MSKGSCHVATEFPNFTVPVHTKADALA